MNNAPSVNPAVNELPIETKFEKSASPEVNSGNTTFSGNSTISSGSLHALNPMSIALSNINFIFFMFLIFISY